MQEERKKERERIVTLAHSHNNAYYSECASERASLVRVVYGDSIEGDSALKASVWNFSLLYITSAEL